MLYALSLGASSDQPSTCANLHAHRSRCVSQDVRWWHNMHTCPSCTLDTEIPIISAQK